MEMVLCYIKQDYEQLFYHTRQIWNAHGIAGTPEMAQIIEFRGITRHMYKDMTGKQLTMETKQEFYQACLSLIIFAIDMQSFDDVKAVYESESKIRSQME